MHFLACAHCGKVTSAWDFTTREALKINNPIAILNGDQVYTEELIRENARLTVQVEAERQQRQKLETNLVQLREENETLLHRVERAEEDLNLAVAGKEREEFLVSKLGRAIKDLHFVMADGDACMICKNKCLMGADTCTPHWKGLDDCEEVSE